ncbi:AFG2-interacting ribosome maturation factor [Vipera latastei]
MRMQFQPQNKSTPRIQGKEQHKTLCTGAGVHEHDEGIIAIVPLEEGLGSGPWGGLPRRDDEREGHAPARRDQGARPEAARGKEALAPAAWQRAARPSVSGRAPANGGGGGGALPKKMAAAAAGEQLREGLRSGTRVLREQQRGWLETLAACLPLLRALGNLARQAEAAQRVSLGETPLRAFARLPERLRLKQRAAMEALLAELRREKLPALREARDAVGARVAPLLALGGPGLAWADLLAGLLDAEALLHAVYLEARLLLLSLSYRDLAAVQAAPRAWERIMQHAQRGDRVAETLLKATFFLEDA